MSNAAAFSELASIRRRLQEIALGPMSPPAKAVKQAVVDASLVLIRRGFLSESSPDGRPWARKKIDNGPILVKSGKMMRAWRGHPTVRGISLTNSRPYSAYQNYGYFQPHYLVARPMVPSQFRPLPKAWERAWNDAANKALERYMHW